MLLPWPLDTPRTCKLAPSLPIFSSGSPSNRGGLACKNIVARQTVRLRAFLILLLRGII